MICDTWPKKGDVIWCFSLYIRYREGHAIGHWKDTEHCYSLELETQRVWDYAGDNYVHRLIQSKTDGKLVELNHHCTRHYDGFSESAGDNDNLDEVEYVTFLCRLLYHLFYVDPYVVHSYNF